MKTPTTLAIRPFPKELLVELKIVSATEEKHLSELVPELLREALKRRKNGKGS